MSSTTKVNACPRCTRSYKLVEDNYCVTCNEIIHKNNKPLESSLTHTNLPPESPPPVASPLIESKDICAICNEEVAELYFCSKVNKAGHKRCLMKEGMNKEESFNSSTYLERWARWEYNTEYQKALLRGRGVVIEFGNLDRLLREAVCHQQGKHEKELDRINKLHNDLYLSYQDLQADKEKVDELLLFNVKELDFQAQENVKLNNRIKDLEKEKSKYAANWVKWHDKQVECEDQLEQKDEIIEKLKEGLEFYADKGNWSEDDQGDMVIMYADARSQGFAILAGKRADQTLKEVKEMEGGE